MSLANAVPRSKRERHVGDAPAVVLLADAALDRHAHVVEEDLGELPSPWSVGSGRISMPGRSMSGCSQVMPWCFGASGSVRTSSSQ